MYPLRVGPLTQVHYLAALRSGVTSVGNPQVIDGCSNLLVELFGDEIGRHARSAVGMSELPFDIAVEIEMVVEVD